MASIKLYKWLIGIFTSIIVIFAMSHNASAANLTFNLDDYSMVTQQRNPFPTCIYNDNTTSVGTCTLGNGRWVKGIQLGTNSYPNGFDVKKGDFIEADLVIYNTGVANAFYRLGIVNAYQAIGDVINISVEETQSITNSANLDVADSGNISSTGTYTYHLIFYVRSDIDDYFFGITSADNNPLSIWGSFDSSDYFLLRLQGFKVWRKNAEGSSQDQQNEINATNDAVDDSEDAGNSSSSSAQQGGASLLSVITGFFNVITSASPTNCVFDAPLNTYFGNQRLSVDLCALDLPAGIGSLTSILAIGILIPFAIHMFNKFINLFRSFQS